MPTLSRVLRYWLLALFLLAPMGRLTLLSGTQQKPVTPKTIAKQVDKEEQELRKVFDRDVGANRAQLEDWEERIKPLMKRAAGLIAEFKPRDWQDEELLSLAGLALYSEEWALASEAYRKYLAEPVPLADADDLRIVAVRADARYRMVRALMEQKRIEEAAAAVAEGDKVDTALPTILAGRVFMRRDLALAYRDAGDYVRAVRQALAGFETGRRISQRMEIPDQARDARDFEPARLIAMAIALLERMDQRKAAEDLQRRWRQTGRGRSAQAEATYEEELTSQRLIGRMAPAIEAKTWIDSAPLTSASLRGKVVLLYFWAMWNTASTRNFPKIKQWQTDFGARNFQVVGITRLFGRGEGETGLTRGGELKSIEGFKSREGITFPFAIAGQDDPTNDERFNAANLPTLVLLDREGKIRRIDRPASTRQFRELREAIDKLTASTQ